MNFGKFFRKIRIEKGLTQPAVAKAMNIALRTYQHYEQGDREPSLAMLVMLADFLNVTTDRLLGRED